VLAEIAAPWYVHWWFPGYAADKAALCTRLTRILLPAQLFFFAGGVSGAVLLVRKQFSVQAVAPLIYNLGTIVGGLVLVRRMGVSSLAIGTVAGAFVGPFLLNAYFAHRLGARFRPIWDPRDPGLREWVRLSLPLMLGVSLVTADGWIISHFASHTAGAVSLMSYAKQLFTAPMAVLAQAAGAASMPFFASLWSQDRRFEFATEVADSVSRVSAMGLLVASALVAMAVPFVDLLFAGGRFTGGDARECAVYFAVFSVAMFLWAAQAIYARASYAAGNTILPMAVGTVVTLVSLPIYYALYRWLGAMGLAIASDVGITMQTLTLALLLHRRRMVSLASLDFAELGRCLLAGTVGGGLVWGAFAALGRALPTQLAHPTRWADLALLAVGTILWTAAVKFLLEITGSALPKVAMKRLGLG